MCMRALLHVLGTKRRGHVHACVYVRLYILIYVCVCVHMLYEDECCGHSMSKSIDDKRRSACLCVCVCVCTYVIQVPHNERCRHVCRNRSIQKENAKNFMCIFMLQCVKMAWYWYYVTKDSKLHTYIHEYIHTRTERQLVACFQHSCWVCWCRAATGTDMADMSSVYFQVVTLQSRAECVCIQYNITVTCSVCMCM